jgi:hypothetical protein
MTITDSKKAVVLKGFFGYAPAELEKARWYSHGGIVKVVKSDLHVMQGEIAWDFPGIKKSNGNHPQEKKAELINE